MNIMTFIDFNSSKSVHRYSCNKVDCERYEESRTLHVTAKFQSNSSASTVFNWLGGVIFMTQFYLLCELVL